MATNERTNVRVYPTALATDVLFYVLVDRVLPKNKQPTYDTPYRTCLPHAPEAFPDHKLCFIAPSDDGTGQKWYFAADRANQDLYNWQITQGNELIRDYVVLRSSYKGRSAEEAIATPMDVVDEFTHPPAATADSAFPQFVFADDSVVEAPAEIKSLYIIIRRRFIDDKRQVKSKGVENLTPQKYRGLVTTTTTVTQEPLTTENLPDPADPAGNVTTVQHEKANDYRYEKAVTEEVIVESGATLDGGRTTEWGVLLSADRVVNEGSAVPHAEGIAEASITPFGNGKAEESKLVYPTPDEDTGIIASLSDQDQDADTKIITDVTKYLITNSKYATQASALRTAGWFVEKKGQDQFHSIMIASKVDTGTLPLAEVFWDTDTVSLPDTLLSLDVLWGEDAGGGAGYSDSATDGSARASASASTSGSIALTVSAGFSGRTRSRITRTYHNGPPSTFTTPYNIIPTTGTITLFGASVDASVSISISEGSSSVGFSKSVGTNGKVIQVGPFLSTNRSAGPTNHVKESETYYAVAGGTNTSAFAQATATGKYQISVPASNPPAITDGMLVAQYQVVRKWRLGIWIKEVVEVFAPGVAAP